MNVALLRALTRWGHEVVSFDLAERVFEVAVQETPDVVILGTVGVAVEILGVLNDFKLDPATSSIQVIILNSQDDPDGTQGRIYRQHGAFACLSDQWTFDQLRLCVEEGIRLAKNASEPD